MLTLDRWRAAGEMGVDRSEPPAGKLPAEGEPPAGEAPELEPELEEAPLARLNPLAAWWQRRRLLETPTATIYFAAAMAGLIGRPGNRERPLRRLGPNVYHRPGPDPHIVVLRGYDERTRRAMARLGPARLHYVIDDDVAAGANEPDLPPRYRLRLARLRDGAMRDMLRRADHVYAASDALAGRLITRSPVETIAPCLAAPVADLAHHEVGSAHHAAGSAHHAVGSPLRLVFPGTRSHRADLESIADDLRRFLQARPQATLTTWLGDAAPAALRLPNARHHPGLDWPAFRHVLRDDRYHVALLPARPTAFNAARSHNKVLECASLGAVPLVGRAMPYAALVERADSGTVVDTDWHAALHHLATDRETLAAQAQRNATLARTLGRPDRLRTFWSERLGL